MDRILILRSAVLGDFIFSSPAINLIREMHIDAEIYLITIQSAHKKDRNAVKVYETKRIQPWLELLDKRVVNRIIPLESLDFGYLLKEISPQIKRINPTKCYVLTDPLVMMKGNLAKYIMLKLLGVKCSIYGWRDFVKNNEERLSADCSKRCINHVLSCLESVLEDKTITCHELTVKFPIVTLEEGDKKACSLWNELNLNDKTVIVISPGGIKEHKIWPEINYIKVIVCLLENENNEIILTGTKKDIDIGRHITEHIMNCRIHNMIAKTDLPFLASILKKASVLLGCDGGTMHLGDAVGCPVVAIMPGLEFPGGAEPWHNVDNAVRIRESCDPCYNYDFCPQGTNNCVRNIDPETVLEKINKVNDRKKALNTIRVQINRQGKLPVLHIKNEKQSQ